MHTRIVIRKKKRSRAKRTMFGCLTVVVAAIVLAICMTTYADPSSSRTEAMVAFICGTLAFVYAMARCIGWWLGRQPSQDQHDTENPAS